MGSSQRVLRVPGGSWRSSRGRRNGGARGILWDEPVRPNMGKIMPGSAYPTRRGGRVKRPDQGQGPSAHPENRPGPRKGGPTSGSRGRQFGHVPLKILKGPTNLLPPPKKRPSVVQNLDRFSSTKVTKFDRLVIKTQNYIQIMSFRSKTPFTHDCQRQRQK